MHVQSLLSVNLLDEPAPPLWLNIMGWHCRACSPQPPAPNPQPPVSELFIQHVGPSLLRNPHL